MSTAKDRSRLLPLPHGFYWGQGIDSDLYAPLKRSQTSQFSNVSDSLSGSKSAILDSLQDCLPLTFLSVKGKGGQSTWALARIKRKTGMSPLGLMVSR